MFDDFFAYARARHTIHLRRSAHVPRSAWTDDPILQQYRFTNVFRELDRTTIWYRQNVRERMACSQEILLATVLFRWFNRISTGEAVFQQRALGLEGEGSGETAWDALVRSGNFGPVRASILQYCGDGPYVTGAYIIKTPNGMDKLDGVIWCLEQFTSLRMPSLVDEYPISIDYRFMAESMRRWPGNFSLEFVWRWLRQFPYMGDFMAYEVVTDLRHSLLRDAKDIMTWANPGPGARRGLNRIHGRPLEHPTPRDQLIQEMRAILEASRDGRNWPQADEPVPGWMLRERHLVIGPWPHWEMRDVEHTLCEFDKYERARLGQGRPRGRFR